MEHFPVPAETARSIVLAFLPAQKLPDTFSAQRTDTNPDLVAEAERRRELARALADERHACGLSQTVVAARMGTAASVVSKLEAGGDVKLSTLQRYCGALGRSVRFQLAPAAPAKRRRA